jgi:hypothetical protein
MSKEFFDGVLLARLCKKTEKYIQNLTQLLSKMYKQIFLWAELYLSGLST